MRYIAIFLILANLGYFGWNYTHPQAVPAAEEPRPLLNTGLSLLSEFQEQGEELTLAAMRQCSIVSGFVDQAQAENLIAKARTRNLNALLDIAEPEGGFQYRVFLPPTPSREIASAILSDLSERVTAEDLGMEIYLITRGELENAVALGLFGDRYLAELVQDQVAELGYGPQIEEIAASARDIRVLLQPTESIRINEPEWLDLAAETEGLTRLENLCEGLVQASQFQ